MNSRGWFGVELRHLAALAAIAEEGSFRGAADRLGYAQSAVSMQIAQLERLAGARVVERCRGRKGVRLTEAGEILLGHVQKILARMDAARADLESHVDAEAGGALKLGVLPGIAPSILPGLLRRLQHVAPDLRLIPVAEPGGNELFGHVERGAIDAAFGERPLEAGPFESRTILCDRRVLLVPAESEWAALTDELTVEALAGLPLIAHGDGHSHSTLEAWFTAQGLKPEVALRCSDETTARAFVAAGLGVAILPQLGLEPNEQTVAIELDGILPPRRLAIYWHSERRLRGSALQTLCTVASEVALRVSDRRSAQELVGEQAALTAAA